MEQLRQLTCIKKRHSQPPPENMHIPLKPEDKLVENLKQIYKLTDLEYSIDYQLYKVQLNRIEGYIQTVEAGLNNKQILVMIHGYGMTSASFFKMIPELKKHFKVYCFDLYGMGGSFRFDFEQKIKNWDDAIDQYTQAIEDWRTTLDLDNFYLLGHSLGGYMIPFYLQKYKPNVRGIFLLSPAGFTSYTEQRCDRWMNRMIENRIGGNSPWKVNALRTIYKTFVWLLQARKMSPFQIFSILPTNKVLNIWFGSDRLRLLDEEKQAFVAYYKNMLDLKTSGDRVLGYFQKYASYSDRPFGDLLPELMDHGYKFWFFYGDMDWMDQVSVRERIAEFDEKYKFNISIVKNCGHQMPIENPYEVLASLQEVFWDLEEINFNEGNHINDSLWDKTHITLKNTINNRIDGISGETSECIFLNHKTKKQITKQVRI